MGYIQGDGRKQGTLFPVVLDDFVPVDRFATAQPQSVAFHFPQRAHTYQRRKIVAE
jgi:hypothetical protein